MNKSKLIISVLVVLFTMGQANSQSVMNDFKSLKIIQYSEGDRVLSKVTLSEEEARQFDIEAYLMDNHQIPRIQIVGSEVKENIMYELKFDSKNSPYNADSYLCRTETHSIRPYLGISLKSNEDFTGVIIKKILDSSRDIVGVLDEGQTIIQFNDTPVSTPCDMMIAVSLCEVGQVVPVDILYKGKTITKLVTVGGQLLKSYNFEACEATVHLAQLESAKNTNAEAEMSMSVYPNPSKGRIFINFESDLTAPLNIYIQAYDGSIIHSETREDFSGQLRMKYDLDGLTGGNYLVVIEQAGQIHHQKVMHFN